jgi:tellurite resistance protein
MEAKMARWNNGINKITSFTEEGNKSLDNFFISKNFTPETENEKQIFSEFSLIKSSLAILIHVATADQDVNSKEKNQIINDLIFQLEQRPYEFNKLSEKFGTNEKEIINNLYDQILGDYKADKLNLEKIINNICVYYQKNPEKRYYLLRLSYYCALSDRAFSEAEQKAIKDLATKMQVPADELKRIESEVNQEVLSTNKH